jgi:hypothetical protein
MASQRQRRTGGRASYANFVGIERKVMNTEAFTSLTILAKALYLDLRRQFNGRNNGDIAIADSVLSPYGWAHSSIHRGVKELTEHGLIHRTRKGGVTAPAVTKASLYAFSDLPVMANPAKGIVGSQPYLGYLTYKPEPRKRRKQKNSASTAWTESVHAVNKTADSCSQAHH